MQRSPAEDGERLARLEALHADERRPDREAAVERLQRAEAGERQRVEVTVVGLHREAQLGERTGRADQPFVRQATPARRFAGARRAVDDQRRVADRHQPLPAPHLAP